MKTFQNIIQTNRAWFCLDCGKCSSVCPVTLNLVGQYTSPRLLVERGVNAGEELVLEDPLLWSCLTCSRCTEICPSEVQFTSLIQEARQLARDQERSGDCTHSGMIAGWVRMMTDPAMEQNRLDWISEDLKISGDSEVIYFPGCLPFYQVAFEKLGCESLEIARSAVRILNLLGVEPIVMGNERCCGHDSFWQGDMDTFNQLAELNLAAIRATGAKKLVTTCPECAYTLKTTYPEQVGGSGVEVLHLVEFLAASDQYRDLVGGNGNPGQTVTYHDPCRLGRYQGIYEEPRALVQGLGYQLVEMEHHHRSSLCCGTSCWSTCGQTNKKNQVARLKEARAAGAERLITSCVKCQIHFMCAQNDPLLGPEIEIEIRDLTTLIGEKLGKA